MSLYDDLPKDGAPAGAGIPDLDEVYQMRARQIVDLRLAQAGIRLAAMLDSVWCPDGRTGENTAE